MNKILIAAALTLVASSPLAFAAKTVTPPPASSLTMEHCTSVEQNFDHNRSHYKSESAFLVAEQKAMSLCRWDKHKNGGVGVGVKTASNS